MSKAAASMTLSALHAEARSALVAAGIANAAFDARLLVEHFTGTTRTQAIAAPEGAIEDRQCAALRAALARRSAGEPVHRILGYREFYGLRLRLSSATLEPRPDTETLVDLVLPFARRRVAGGGSCRILDLGTGTGAIALALLSKLPEAAAFGADLSADALDSAAANADILGLAPRFKTIRSDWFSEIEGHFDLIVSNPPYIATTVWAGLEREVHDFDPRLALDGGEDGLGAYRAIAGSVAAFLMPGGIVAVEVGHDQKSAVAALFAEHGFQVRAIARDLGGHERAITFGLDEVMELS